MTHYHQTAAAATPKLQSLVLVLVVVLGPWQTSCLWAPANTGLCPCQAWSTIGLHLSGLMC
jgi:hypothetical protein